jgi:hemerythrin
MTATHLLADHHAQLSALLESLAGDRAARVARLLELVDKLTAHLAVESHFFYDRVRDASGDSLERCDRHHATIRSALRNVVKAAAHDDDSFEREVEFLRTVLHRHILEEQALAPIAERAVPPRELAALGARMHDFYASAVAGSARAR